MGEERCAATTNDASGQPVAGGERHRVAPCVQILMHYALFVFCGTGLDSCPQSVLNCVCKSCDYNAMYNVCVFVNFGRLMVRELLPLLVIAAASTFKLWSDVVDTRCFDVH